jgi:hypothetical protein
VGSELQSWPLADGLAVEDHATEFFLVFRGDGHDVTISLDAPVAEALARFILQRRGSAASGSRENRS